jgi:molybdopterin-guanine dinucleotide biosynthesis protein A
MLPRDLVARLYAATQQHDAPLAIAKTGDRLHSVFALAHRRVLPDLTAYLQEGERKVALWFARIGGVEVPFDDQPDAFRNINTQDELDALRQRLPSLQETLS